MEIGLRMFINGRQVAPTLSWSILRSGPTSTVHGQPRRRLEASMCNLPGLSAPVECVDPASKRACLQSSSARSEALESAERSRCQWL